MSVSLFLAHGSPMLAVEDHDYSRFLRQFSKQIETPKAIVIFTAHWESDQLTISSTDDIYETIYDFYGFPDVLYTLQYPARGSVEIATKIANLFSKQGIPNQINSTRGLDHGSWVLLKHLYPTFRQSLPTSKSTVCYWTCDPRIAQGRNHGDRKWWHRS
jgi:4,5-DOPA dioxygenase extradiol